MKAISLWQPWATLIATGAKQIETRSWATSYRGPIAIHAAKRKVRKELIELAEWEEYRAALGVTTMESEQAEEKLALEKMLALPYGAIVATANLVNCLPTHEITRDLIKTHNGWDEYDMGNYGYMRWGWMLTDIKPLAQPIPYKGEQGIFNVPDSVIETRMRELALARMPQEQPIMCGHCRTKIEVSVNNQKCKCGRCELVWKSEGACYGRRIR